MARPSAPRLCLEAEVAGWGYFVAAAPCAPRRAPPAPGWPCVARRPPPPGAPPGPPPSLSRPAALGEQPARGAATVRRAARGLDVVADDRAGGLLEALVPVVLPRDEHRDAFDEAAARLEHLLDVPLGRLLGADRQVGDDHVG